MQPEKTEKNSLLAISAKLQKILRDHKKGIPILQEMADRIRQRAERNRLVKE
jgi:hypothetical protein